MTLGAVNKLSQGPPDQGVPAPYTPSKLAACKSGRICHAQDQDGSSGVRVGGRIALRDWGVPAYADICDHLAAKIAQLRAEEANVLPDMERQFGGSYLSGDPDYPVATAPGQYQRRALRSFDRQLVILRKQRALYEREYAKKHCGEYRAQRDAAAAAATGAALGAIGFGIMSGAMSSGYRGGYRSGGSSGRSGYPSGGSGGSYRRY